MIKTVLFLMLLAQSVLAGAPYPGCVLTGTTAKCTKSIIDVNGNAQIQSGTVDPTSSATNAPAGSLYMNTSNSNVYKKNDAGSTTNWTALPTSSATTDSAKFFSNMGLAASVATNALTVSLKTAAGADGSGGSPIKAAFRNGTATTGQYAVSSITAALSIVVPASATLGQQSAMNQYVWVYLLNDAGTIDICVSGVDVFFDEVLNSATAITSGSTSGSVLYCASAHTGAKPTRVIGRLLVNESTAGTWASAPTEIDVNPIIARKFTKEATATTIITATTSNPTKGTVQTVDRMIWHQEGQYLIERLEFQQSDATSSAIGSGDYLFSILPATTGCTADSSLITFYTAVIGLGTFQASNDIGPAGASQNTPAAIVGFASMYDGSNFRIFGLNGGSAAAVSSSAYAINNNGSTYHASIRVPCKGWSEYGP